MPVGHREYTLFGLPPWSPLTVSPVEFQEFRTHSQCGYRTRGNLRLPSRMPDDAQPGTNPRKSGYSPRLRPQHISRYTANGEAMPVQQTDSMGTPPSDEGLRCLTCGYNLTGLAEPRCPECGADFDPADLRARHADRPKPVPGWDDGTNLLLAFPLTCLKMWFMPLRFGRDFPRVPCRKSAMLFRWLALAITLGIVMLAGSRYFHVTIVLCTTLGVILCELFVAASLDCRLQTRESASPPQRGAAFWQALVGYYRSHAIVSATIIAVQIKQPVILVGLLDPLPEGIILSIMFWWIGLGLAASGAGKISTDRALGILLIPLMGCLAVGLTLIAAVLLLGLSYVTK